MKVRQSGKFVIVENEQDKKDMLDLYCVCGHTLREHVYKNTFGAKKTFETGRCTTSDHCSQFKTYGKIETRLYDYPEQQAY
jgi:hypothetical protein